MLTKENLLNLSDRLPSVFSIDDVIEELLFLEKIQKGMLDSNNNNVFVHEEVVERLGKWAK